MRNLIEQKEYELAETIRAGSEKLARELAKEGGQRYGSSVFDGNWYVGTGKELKKAGVADVLGKGNAKIPKYIGKNMDRVSASAREAKTEFAKGNIKFGVMAMTDALSELSQVYSALEDVDGRFAAVKKNIKDAIAQSIRFDKEL